MEKIYIIGAGGFGREAAWLIERINSIEPAWDIQGFIDDNAEKQGKHEGKYPVLGGCSLFGLLEEEIWAVCAIGNAAIRSKVIEKVSKYRNVKFATLVDPSVICSHAVSIGEGSIICAGVILTVDITIGRHVIINLDCTIGHDASIKDFVTIYPSVNVSGCVEVGEESELGTGAQVIQGKRIGEKTIVGAGAVVTKNLPGGCTVVGMPAGQIDRKGDRQ